MDNITPNNTNTDTQPKGNVRNEKKASKGGRFISYFAIALIASLIGGLISPYILSNYVYGNNSAGGDSQITQPHGTGETYSVNNEASSIVSVAAKKSMSSVVGITTVKVQRYGFMEQEVDGVGSGG